MTKAISKIKNNNSRVVEAKKKLLPFLDMRTVGKYIKNEELIILEKDIKFKEFKKLFKHVEAIVNGEGFMNKKVNNGAVAEWVYSSRTRKVLNTYFAYDTDLENAKTMSICIFENSENKKYPFIFFSQEGEEHRIENEIDGGVCDALNDLYADAGGKDFYVVMIFKKNILALSQSKSPMKKLKK